MSNNQGRLLPNCCNKCKKTDAVTHEFKTFTVLRSGAHTDNRIKDLCYQCFTQGKVIIVIVLIYATIGCNNCPTREYSAYGQWMITVRSSSDGSTVVRYDPAEHVRFMNFLPSDTLEWFAKENANCYEKGMVSADRVTVELHEDSIAVDLGNVIMCGIRATEVYTPMVVCTQ